MTMPSTKYFWQIRYTITPGSIDSLLKRLDGQTPVPEETLLRCSIIPRGSTACPGGVPGRAGA